MGRPELDKRITNSMKGWGAGYDSTVGCSHDTMADTIDSIIDSKSVTLNSMDKMDASHAKPSSKNPGVDRGFLAKANPQMDTTGHGKLSRSCQD